MVQFNLVPSEKKVFHSQINLIIFIFHQIKQINLKK